MKQWEGGEFQWICYFVYICYKFAMRSKLINEGGFKIGREMM
jgi:hypothetical protein